MKTKTMKCECGETIGYSPSFQSYECMECDRCYNAFGQELAPLDNWQEEYSREEDY